MAARQTGLLMPIQDEAVRRTDVSAEFDFYEPEIVCYLTPLFACWSFKQADKKSRLQVERIDLIVVVPVCLVLVLNRYFWEEMGSCVHAILQSPLINVPILLAISWLRYMRSWTSRIDHRLTKPDPLLNGRSRLHKQFWGKVTVSLSPEGITLGRRYGDTRFFCWAQVKAIYRLGQAWYFLTDKGRFPRLYTEQKIALVPLDSLKMPEDDERIRALCKAHWLGTIKIGDD